ncbi:hypothetical protein CNR22_00845 [Sphingobacteriaceae bacterium]|nr:hypothetical protein CNR22_00845 [Sphingobacteriaceae bacterium]
MKKNYKSLTAFIVLLSMLTLKMGALSGVVTINNSIAASATNYTSFTSFAAALNTGGLTGTLVVNVGGTGPYTEQVTFSQITGASATNTITINGNGYILTYNATSGSMHTMKLDGTDYFYVNNLQIRGTNTNYAWPVFLTNQANYNAFTTCTISVPVNATGYYTGAFVLSSNSSYWSGGNAGSYNMVENTTLIGGYMCIYADGAYSGASTTNNTFKNCHISDWYQYGISAYYSRNLKVDGCLFDRLTSTTNNYPYLFYGYGPQGLRFVNNTIEKVMNASQSSTGQFICFYNVGGNPNPSNTNKITNNIVRNIQFNGYIYMFMYCYGGIEISHNTINLDHTAASGGNTYTYMFYYCYSSGGQVLTVKNNIFTITRGGSGQKIGYWDYNSTFTGHQFNYNDWYINGLGGNNYFAQLNGTNVSSFSSLQTYSVEANGFNVDPIYTNSAAGDLHPTNNTINNTGTPLNVGTDHDGAPRSQTNPDIGALEFLSNTCVSTPTNISVVTPTYALCPNKNADIGVNGYTSDLGVTYQWLTSTTSSVGPWTVISGANSVYYTTPNLNATTYYGVAVSCTLVGTTATVANVINIAGTSTSVVPVHEGFEGINMPNDFPNCSWFAPNQGGTALTYTGSANQNRSARTGTKFGAFATSYVSGTNAYYTNGIQLIAGVTYSASVWWKTEFYGYTNVTDLSMKYGTTQSQTGLTTIATTGGPASSGIYTPLTNTFVVATSGLYYVSLQVTTNGSYGTNYLSWDDLDIIIPCSLNTTSVTVSTSTNVLCNGQPLDLSATGADEYTWNNGATGGNITEYPNQNMQYYVVATNTLSGCSQTLNAQYVTVLQSPAIIVVGSKPAVCVGDNITLMANGAPSYVWNTNATGAVITVTPGQSTTYTVTGTNAAGCSTSTEYSVIVNPNPTITVSSTANSNQICVGEYATLTGNGAVSFAWASSTGFIQSNVAMVNPVANTVYTVSGTGANGCVGKTTYVLNVDACTGLSKVNATSGIKLYPNPTAASFVVESNSTSVKTIEVVDLTGRVILTNTNSDLNTNINISTFANGVYYVKVKSENATEVIKVVKQ